MSLYKIDRELESLVDPETGELLDFERFAELRMERERKIEDIALWHKNEVMEAKAIREEELALAERRKAHEKRAESLRNYLAELLCGEKFETPRVAVTYRRSEAVEVDGNFVAWAALGHGDLLTQRAPEPNKTAIKQYLKGGGECPHAALVVRRNMGVR